MNSYVPTHLDLFSGIGGFALAVRWAGFRTIAFCEIDKYCRKVLAKNFGPLAHTSSMRLDASESEDSTTEVQRGNPLIRSTNRQRPEMGRKNPRLIPNIFDLDGRDFYGVDLITGGFPCQPFSVAGKRRGAADNRAIWPQMFRVISEARPAWVLGENVPGIIAMELDNVLSQLEGIGYATRTFVIPACAVDARHRRDRVWIIGRHISNSTSGGSLESIDTGECRTEQSAGFCGEQDLSHSEHQQLDRNGRTRRRRSELTDSCRRESQSRLGGMVDGVSRWLDEPDIPRVATGNKDRVNRLKGLGNAIVPSVAHAILVEIRNLIRRE